MFHTQFIFNDKKINIMRRLVLVLIAVLLYGSVYAQLCPPYYPSTIHGQNTINYFSATRVHDLRIEEFDDGYDGYITSLEGLSELTFVGGDLAIHDNNSLPNLNGLENLDTIMGVLYISHNNTLDNFEGLNNLKFVGGDIIIVNNDDLTNFEGLNNLNYIGGDFEVGGYSAVSDRGNDEMVNFSGLENLTYIGGNVNIESNPDLENLSGLESLTYLNGHLNILSNSDLTSLSGLDNLTSVGKTLRVFRNNTLSDISALENLTTVWGLSVTENLFVVNLDALQNLTSAERIYIVNNNNLTDISGLSNLDDTALVDIHIYDNQNLSACSISNVCGHLENGGAATIYDNAIGCNSADDVVSSCGLSLPCPAGSLIFTNQQQIDNFTLNYPNCTQLANVLIEGEGNSLISNLNGLGSVTSIVKDLIIEDNYLYPLLLKNLEGLDNLSSIGGNLIITRADSLNTLEGLDNLTSIGGYLEIRSNHALTTLSALANVSSSLEGLSIIQNNALTSLNGLEGIDSIENNLAIYGDNMLLSTLNGLNNLTSVGGNLLIGGYHYNDNYNYDNLSLTNLEGLESLTSVGGNLEIISSESLTSLAGLNNLTSIGGNLIIGRYYYYVSIYSTNSNPSLASIAALGNLTSVGGDMEISGNPLLTSLNGLNNLSFVGGDLGIGAQMDNTSLSGIEMDMLASIGGSLVIGRTSQINTSLLQVSLDNLLSIGNNLTIIGNESLTGVGMDNLTSIGGSLLTGYRYGASSDGNPLLSEINVENLTTIGGNLQLILNESLPDLTGFSSLTSIGNDFILGRSPSSGISYGNPLLTNLVGLENLTSIGGKLDITDNNALVNLSGLENLTYIGCNVAIGDNDSLTHLGNLVSLESIGGYHLYIVGNPQLATCSIESICNYIADDGVTNIYNNAPGCDSKTEVEDACMSVTVCPQGDLIFTTQQEIDDFAMNFSACTEITGNLYIGSTTEILSAINDLSPLSQLTSIQGKLTIIKNAALTSLDGLENVSTINGNIYIGSNPTLSSLAEWDNLASIGGNFVIRNNGLSDLSDFNNLTSIGSYINIGPDTTLISLAGLENVTSINSYIHVHDNIALNSLNGLDNIDYTTITDLRILDNPQLNICDVPSICNYLENGGTATVSNNDPGCNTQAEVETACMPSACPNSFSPASQQEVDDFPLNYPNCTEIQGDVSIALASGVTNLDGLSQITSIGGNLDLGSSGTADLVDILGLQNLTSIGGDLLIFFNENLTSLDGLENITSIGGNVTIEQNHQLSTCEVQSICNYILNGGTATINDNASGCNSPAEVEAACLGLVSTSSPEDAPTISFSPNPNFGKFEVKGITQGTYQIYDTKGRTIQSGELENDALIDISRESQGVYFISFFTDNQIYTKKIIKM